MSCPTCGCEGHDGASVGCAVLVALFLLDVVAAFFVGAWTAGGMR